MFTLLIAGVSFVVSIVATIFILFLKALMLAIAAYLVVNVIEYITTLVRRGAYIISKLWRFWRGRPNPTVIEVEGETVRLEDAPQEVQDAVANGKEVVVKQPA